MAVSYKESKERTAYDALRLQKIIFTIAVYYILNSLHPKRHRPLSFHTFTAVVKDAVQGIILQIFPVLDLIDKPIFIELITGLPRIEGTSDDPRWQQAVLDLMDVEDCAAEDFTVTGSVRRSFLLLQRISLTENRSFPAHSPPELCTSILK